MIAPSRYAAFISYSHRDRKWAEWLHRAIETYRIPKGLLRDGAKPALTPIFLDRAELPSSADLAESVREALEASAYLVVICSPAAAHSRWVNEEIRLFKSLGRADRILCLIVAGEPSAAGAGPEQCFPVALRYTVSSGHITDALASEPLAADVRAQKDSRSAARLKIIAGLLSLPLDRLRQREHVRWQRRLAIIATASGIGCVAFGTLAVVAFHSRNEAVRQRGIAQQQSLTARRTAEFLKSLFTVSDPSEARGNTITAREVLDRGVQQISQQLKHEPLMRADLTTTLGEVYGGLGLLTNAEKLLADARTVPGQSQEMVARQATALGEIRQARGEYATTLPLLDQASRLLEQSTSTDYMLRARLWAAYGDVYQGLNDYPRSRANYTRLVSLANERPDVGPSMLARGLEGVAQADIEEGQLDDADRRLRQALTSQIAASGELHPRTSELLNELGSLEYTRGNSIAAIGYYQRSVTVTRRVLGEQHPELAHSLNNLARVLLERRRFEEARKLLQEANRIRAGQVLETSDLAAYVVNNLAVTQLELGNYQAAEPLFESGLRAAIANKHRLQPPILTGLADLKCLTGRYADGLKLLDEARPLMAERYPDDPWRMAYIDSVRGGCLTRAGRLAEAEPLLKASTPILLRRWPRESLYGHDAVARNERLQALIKRASGERERDTRVLTSNDVELSPIEPR